VIRRGLPAALLLSFPLMAAGLAAQEPTPGERIGEAVVVDFSPDQPEPVSTGGAFVRSLIIPGWGHLLTESYFRGGFYAAVQGGSYWMLWKSLSRRREAQRFRAMEEAIAMDRYRAQGVVDPDSLRFLAGTDPALEQWDELLERRDEQVEDWVFLAAFLALFGAVDAFVSAHLIDFPEALSIQLLPGPGSLDGRNPSVEVRVSVPADAALSLVPWLRGR